MSPTDDFAQERRARLAAERLLKSKQEELFQANQKLALHARSLSDEIIVKREETEILRGRNDQALEDLEKANHAVTIAERRLWDSVQTIDDGFAVFDQNGIMIAANGAYLAPFEDLDVMRTGISYEEVVHLMVDEGIVDIGKFTRSEWIDRSLTRWHSDIIEPITIRLWNGTYVKCIDRRSRDGDMVSLALDITDTIKYERELKMARDKAEAANRAKSAFLANMSHELRTPMNGVVGMAELLTEGTLNEEQRLYVNTIKSSGEALLGLINDVLDFSKIEAEKLSLHPEEFDLERCIHEVVILLQPAAHEKGIDLIIDFDMFLPAKFIGDPGRLRQVLINLVGNAVKFTAKGHVLIRAVGIPQGDGTQERVHVSVEDTGIGIPPDMVEHVFGSFNQVEDAPNRKFEGTGLGLAITKELIVLMDGEIWVESEHGNGSCFGFHITMPVAEPANSQPCTIPKWLKRAVLVDHQQAHRAILEKQLRRLGVEVIEFSSNEALRDAWPISGDIYLIDHALPGTDIHTLVHDIRTAQGDTPILLMTAGQVSAKKLSLQGTKMLQKPLLRRDLTQTLAALETPVRQPEPIVSAVAAALPEPTSTEEDLTAQSAQTTPTKAITRPLQAARKMRILAAEDNKTNQLVFRKMVKSLDIELIFARNGREAVELYQSFSPDLIFMDISMPEIDGKEATRQIRMLESKSGGHTPIVALTAHAMAGDDQEILAAGLDHYLTKPLRKAAIIGRIIEEMPTDCAPLHLPETKDECALAAQSISGGEEHCHTFAQSTASTDEALPETTWKNPLGEHRPNMAEKESLPAHP